MVQYRRELLRLLADSMMPSSFRWEFVPQTTLLPCQDARELVFGQRPDVEAALATFRRQVVRTAGDSLWLRLALRSRPMAASGGLGAWLAAAYGAVIGNPHVASCAEVVLGAF